MKKTSSQPFLKWAGGKRRLLPTLLPLLPSGSRLIEPFVGAGSVFLASDIDTLVLADSNPVLMSVYRRLQADAPAFIALAKPYFTEAHRTPEAYNELRQTFNDPATPDPIRAALFVYINRFGFNGLYRTNRRGECNTPYGHPKALPLFPAAAMQACAERLQGAELHCADFEKVMSKALPGDLVYCDPPYADQTDKASFTAYGQAGFSWADQERLANKARALVASGVTVVISNHDTPATRALYHGAELHQLTVRRSIAAASVARDEVGELVAVFAPGNPALVVVPTVRVKESTGQASFPLPDIADLSAMSLHPFHVTQPVTENPMSEIELTPEPAPALPELARQLGLRPVRAWVPDDTTYKKTSSGAERTRRARKKAGADGVKQVSLSVPVVHHPLLKLFAERTRAGESVATVLTEMLQTIRPETVPPTQVLPTLPGWRGWLLRRLLPSESLARLPHSRS